MTALNSILILLVAFLAVFCEAAFTGTRAWFGAQVDLLPALMVCAALDAGINGVVLLALAGGLMFDSLSANPLGATVLPLFAVGFPIYLRRELILRDQIFAQFVLGFAASAAAPALTLLLLFTAGHSPLFGWASLWQWLVMSLGGALATPVLFFLFDWLRRVFGYKPVVESSFRPDREIRRGRS